MAFLFLLAWPPLLVALIRQSGSPLRLLQKAGAFSPRLMLRTRARNGGMAKTPEPPKPTTWTIYKLAAKAVRLGQVGAPTTAIEKGASSRCRLTG
jgi:hypothetical protein